MLGACHPGGREKILGYKQLHFYFGFQILWGIAVFDCEKVKFDAEKGCEFADCVIPIRSSLRYRTAVNVSRLSIVSCLQGELCRYYRRVCRAI